MFVLIVYQTEKDNTISETRNTGERKSQHKTLSRADNVNHRQNILTYLSFFIEINLHKLVVHLVHQHNFVDTND